MVLLALSIGYLAKTFAKEKPAVVVVLKDLNSQYWEIVKAGAEKGFRDFGVSGKVLATANGWGEEQSELLKEVLHDSPDVLIVSPIYAPLILPILDEFVENNIPVLLLDTDLPWSEKTAYIGSDNFELGRKAGFLLASHLQPGDKVALIGGDVNSPVSSERIAGAKGSFEAVHIDVATQRVNLTNRSPLVRKAVEDILLLHPDVKAIMATNDVLALQAIEVIKENGFTIPVTGADGTIEMVELIEGEVLPGTVAQNPYDMGYLSVEMAERVINGEVVENIDSGVDIIIKGNAKDRLDFFKDLLK
nr:sugar ABC transporter substrate-binding protein [Halalkalibacter alkaliphilus]